MNDSMGKAKRFHERCAVVDMHVHPALKTYLFNKKLDKRYWTGGAWNPFTMRVDLPKIIEGGVDAIVSTVYLPEKKMVDDCWALKLLYLFLGTRLRSIVKDNPFDVTMKMIDRFEQGVEAARIQGKPVAEVAKSVADLHRILGEGKIAVLHSIEGGHSLNGKIENVRKFFDRGVCLLTLSHFYENALGPTVGGIPKNKKFFCCFQNEKEQSGRLTEFGRAVVEEMMRLGMLIDITHCNPEIRAEVLEMNQNRHPIVCTHVGIQTMNPVAYNLEDTEIKRIADTGGVIGNILKNYWLVGSEEKNGLHHVVATVKHLKKIGGIDCITLGSDFDGFTDPPDDIKDISEMPRLTYALLNAGFSEGELEKILGKNALRVIGEGWGRKEP